MTVQPTRPDTDPDGEMGADVIPIRPIEHRLTEEFGRPLPMPVGKDTSFEVDLDDPTERETSRAPVYVDVTAKDHVVMPIIPAWMRSREGRRATLEWAWKRTWHTSAFHAVRSPWYALQALFWAVVGVCRTVRAVGRWWWVAEAAKLRDFAVDEDNWLEYKQNLDKVRSIRMFRAFPTFGGLVATIGAYAYLAMMQPIWMLVVIIAIQVPPLARYGRGPRPPIISSAIVKPHFRKLNADIVLRALYVAGLGHPEKPGQQIEFGSTMARDARGTGSQVMVILPHGGTFDDAVKAREKIASGLDVALFQVYLTKVPTSIRRFVLFVTDRDPLAIPAGRTPMLDLKPRNIWRPCPLGLDERGRMVELLLLWLSILVGAQPRKGKTFTARLLALWAALDPWVRLFVVDGKNSPDWRSFALVAERMIYGTQPNRTGHPVNQLLDLLYMIKKHINEVNDKLSQLPIELCPEGKLTEELAHDPRYPWARVVVLVIEEFQVYFELDDQEINKEVAGLLSFIGAVGPSAGVIPIYASQKPSGVGAGDVARLFNRVRDNVTARIALRCGNRTVSEAVLGGDAYGEGIDASQIPVEAKGVGFLYGVTDHVPMTRFHLADKLDVQAILQAARTHREALGLLRGEAAGETVLAEVIDPLADTLSVFLDTEANLSWPRIAARLAERYPDRYADLTGDAISARLRSLGVKGKSVKDAEHFEKGVGQGCARKTVEEVAAKRAARV